VKPTVHNPEGKWLDTLGRSSPVCCNPAKRHRRSSRTQGELFAPRPVLAVYTPDTNFVRRRSFHAITRTKPARGPWPTPLQGCGCTGRFGRLWPRKNTRESSPPRRERSSSSSQKGRSSISSRSAPGYSLHQWVTSAWVVFIPILSAKRKLSRNGVVQGSKPFVDEWSPLGSNHGIVAEPGVDAWTKGGRFPRPVGSHSRDRVVGIESLSRPESSVRKQRLKATPSHAVRQKVQEVERSDIGMCEMLLRALCIHDLEAAYRETRPSRTHWFPYRSRF